MGDNNEKGILIKKDKKEIKVEDVVESSTVAIEQMKQAALRVSRDIGRGIKIELNAIDNDQRQNCSVKILIEID